MLSALYKAQLFLVCKGKNKFNILLWNYWIILFEKNHESDHSCWNNIQHEVRWMWIPLREIVFAWYSNWLLSSNWLGPFLFFYKWSWIIYRRIFSESRKSGCISLMCYVKSCFSFFIFLHFCVLFSLFVLSNNNLRYPLSICLLYCLLSINTLLLVDVY